MIILKGSPLSTQHIYGFFRNSFYMKKEGKEMKKRYIQELSEQYQNGVIEGYLELYIGLYFGDKRKRDLDNYNKIILDSMNGIVYNDDCQIKKLTLEKFYDKENPRIEIKIGLESQK